MATIAAMGCSCAAAAVVVTSPFATSVTQRSALAFGPPGHVKRGLPSSSGGLIAINAGQERRRFSKLGVHTNVNLNGLETGPTTEEAKVEEELENCDGFFEKAFLAAAVALTPLVDVEAAFAAKGEFGLLESKPFGLIHPIFMTGLFGVTLYAAYLGWKARRTRTIQAEIAELQKQVKPVAVAAGPFGLSSKSQDELPSEIEAQISSLTEERKELVKGNFKDKHFSVGANLLRFGIFSSVAGAADTWFKTGQLLVGPHLFAGAGLTIGWALAASFVPAMQKGDNRARNLHIGVNVINVGLFIVQLVTGFHMIEKVVFTDY